MMSIGKLILHVKAELGYGFVEGVRVSGIVNYYYDFQFDTKIQFPYNRVLRKQFVIETGKAFSKFRQRGWPENVPKL